MTRRLTPSSNRDRGLRRAGSDGSDRVETLQSIQDTFAAPSGCRRDHRHRGRNATAITHRVTLCEDLTRPSSVAGPRCTHCDRCAMSQAADTSGPSIFKCWNGLYDCAIPIAPKGQVLGYFLCGQIFTDTPDSGRYANTAGEIGVDPDEYLRALEDVAIVPYEQYEGAVQSMHVLAEMIAEQAAASIDSLQMLEEARRAKEAPSHLWRSSTRFSRLARHRLSARLPGDAGVDRRQTWPG